MPGVRTAGVPIRYAVTAVIDIYHLGLAPGPEEGSDGLVSVSAPLPGELVDALGADVREHFLGHLALAVSRFTRRYVERTELVFAGVASHSCRPVGDSRATIRPEKVS